MFDGSIMNSNKRYILASWLGGGIFLLGLILCALRASEIIQHKITTAKITSVEEVPGECRRVSGKYGNCIQANLGVEFPINKAGETRTGTIHVEHAREALQPGEQIKVMFLDGKPETVRPADFSSGWKGPLGVLFLGSLILFVSYTGRPAQSRDQAANSRAANGS